MKARSRDLAAGGTRNGWSSWGCRSPQKRGTQESTERSGKYAGQSPAVSERDLAYARQEAEEIRGQHREKLRPMAEMEKRKAMAAVEMEARRALLEKKEELVSRIFTEAERRLEEMRGSQGYVNAISKLIEEGVASIGGDSIIEFGEKDKEVSTEGSVSSIELQVTGSLGRDLRLQFRCVGDNISAGVIIRSENGRVIVDNSFSTRLRILKEELRGEVCEMLLEE